MAAAAMAAASFAALQGHAASYHGLLPQPVWTLHKGCTSMMTTSAGSTRLDSDDRLCVEKSYIGTLTGRMACTGTVLSTWQLNS